MADHDLLADAAQGFRNYLRTVVSLPSQRDDVLLWMKTAYTEGWLNARAMTQLEDSCAVLNEDSALAETEGLR
jgi:hypothetical protein